jgi:radical SAM superfamily enzyme YgiQ (UPF0313 family)
MPEKIILVNSITLYKSVVIFNHGLLSLGTILKGKGYEVEIVDFNRLVRTGEIPEGKSGEMVNKMCDYLTDKKPAVIGFNTICAFYPNSILLAGLVKKKYPSVKIVFGGPQASSCPVETLTSFDWIDMIAIGESELNILNIIEALTGKASLESVPGIAYRKDGRIFQNPQADLIRDLDSLPFPDYSLIPHIKSITEMSVDVGRGCPFSCKFCSTKTFWKKKFRLKSVTRIIQEMDQLNNEYGFKHFTFLHDHFTVNKKTIIDFCNSLKADGKIYTWECFSRADTLDKEMIQLMKSAGCTKILIGIETGSAHMQQLIGKKLDLPSAWEVIKEITRNNIKVKLSFIYGFPEEEERDLIQTLDLIRRSVVSGVDDVSLYPFVLLNGAEYYDRYKDDLVHMETVNSFVDDFNIEETTQLIRNHPELFPNYFTFPSSFFEKYKYLDVFISFYSFLQRYFQHTFKNLLEKFGLELGAFYLDLLRNDPQLGQTLTGAVKNGENLEMKKILLLYISFLESYIGNNPLHSDMAEIFETEKFLLCLRAGIPVT